MSGRADYQQITTNNDTIFQGKDGEQEVEERGEGQEEVKEGAKGKERTQARPSGLFVYFCFLFVFLPLCLQEKNHMKTSDKMR